MSDLLCTAISAGISYRTTSAVMVYVWCFCLSCLADSTFIFMIPVKKNIEYMLII